MSNALVAVFENQADAQRAHDALTSDGFSQDNLRLTSAEGAETTTSRSGNGGGDKSFGQKIGSIFGFGKDNDNETYSEAVRRGNCVLSVDVADDDEANRAEGILEQHDPVDIDERTAQWRESGWQGFQAGDQTNGGRTDVGRSAGGHATGDEVIPIVEEEIQVGKRETRRGGTRVRSHNYEKPVEETVNLREQHTTVTSRAADRPATEADIGYGEVDFEHRDTAEEAVVAKDARVVEEVVVGQESSDRTETVKDSVRRTDVDVEQLDDERSTTSGSERKTR
jgi:stress response protein YsnF